MSGEAKDRTIASLAADVSRLQDELTRKADQLVVALAEVEELQYDISDFTSDLADLQKRHSEQSRELATTNGQPGRGKGFAMDGSRLPRKNAAGSPTTVGRQPPEYSPASSPKEIPHPPVPSPAADVHIQIERELGKDKTIATPTKELEERRERGQAGPKAAQFKSPT